MLLRICPKHSRVNEYDAWRRELDIKGYLLYRKTPALIQSCDVCKKENDLLQTIRELREE